MISGEDDQEDAASVVRALRLLRSMEFFKEIDKKNYIIWCDCGKHFRNSLVMGYIFKELKESRI